MVEITLVVAVSLLVVGVVASVVPVIPGAVFSIGGLFFYRWVAGEPSLLVFVVLLLVSLTAVVLDYLATVVSARTAGVSLRTATVAVVVGFVLAFVSGPIGFLGGTAGFVFAAELWRGRDVRGAWKAAVRTTYGVAVSTYLRVVLNLVVLVGFVVAVVV